MAVIISEACMRCGACIPNCTYDVLDADGEGKIIVDANKCRECGECLDSCPVSAISLPGGVKTKVHEDRTSEAVKKSTDNETDANSEEITFTRPRVKRTKARPVSEINPALKDYDGVWVFAEHQEGKVAGVTLELLGEAKKLAAKLDTKVSAVLIGEGVEAVVSVLCEHGADRVYLLDNPVFHFYRAETYMEACCYLIDRYKPEIFLIGATTSGRDLAGAVATSLRTGLTADCTGLDIDLEKRLLLASRPAFGGNIMATIVCENHRPQMATVRPRVMQMPEAEPGRECELIREMIEIKDQDLKTRVLEIVREQADNVKLEDARIIVCGGRGVQNEKGFALLDEFAKIIGGTLAGSRGAVEKGLIDHKHQVGQTGQTVSPKLYFAVGISGAIQHVVGMQGSETIVAINTDPECPMMKLATFGIAGDAFEVLPILMEEFRKALYKTPEQKVSAL